jgi:tRNA pseudouridine13 synthase
MSDSPHWTPFHRLPRAHGAPPLQGKLRALPADFQVDELLGFEPDSDGEHVLLQIRKSGLNTEEAVGRIARHAGLKPRDLGFCGLKDRNAVTTQWVSVGLAGRPEPDWSALHDGQLEILLASRHRRKLKRGAARGNRFTIRAGDLTGDRAVAERRLGLLAERGVPNYFGDQRFGRDYGNLEGAERLFRGEAKRLRPHLKGLYLSAARSQVFNQLLALRVDDGSWERAVDGDLMQLQGSRAWFAIDQPDQDILRRLGEMDIHPTGPLWGRGELPSSGQAARLEREVGARFAPWCDGLERFGLKQERRGLRLAPAGLQWRWEGDSLVLEFELPAGAFATSVLRELVTQPE